MCLPTPPSQLEVSFTYFFPIGMAFISSSCLIAMARTSSIMLNKSGENEPPCLVPGVNGNAFSFPH